MTAGMLEIALEAELVRLPSAPGEALMQVIASEIVLLLEFAEAELVQH